MKGQKRKWNYHRQSERFQLGLDTCAMHPVERCQNTIFIGAQLGEFPILSYECCKKSKNQKFFFAAFCRKESNAKISHKYCGDAARRQLPRLGRGEKVKVWQVRKKKPKRKRNEKKRKTRENSSAAAAVEG